ncbi:MAG: cyclic nucleotide-binding domain-containing protein, partial [Bryobacteraceae bacterium]
MSSEPQFHSSVLRDEIVHLDGVRKTLLRRGHSLLSSNELNEDLYLLESGFVKIARMESGGRQVILRIACAGDLIGEHILWPGARADVVAEAIHDAILFSIPREVFTSGAERRPQLWRALSA